MLFRVLGPVEVCDQQGRTVTVGGRKQRTLLTALLTRANEWVSSRRLTEVLWAGTPPRSAMANLKTYIWELRQALPATAAGAERIEGRRGEYRILVGAAELDLLAFTDLVARGREATTHGDLVIAGELLHRAVELWRGEFAEDLPDADALSSDRSSLAEDRWTALEEWVDARLSLGLHAEVIRDIRGLLAEQPLRERLWQQMMLALYRSGRRAESLAAYQELYQMLDRELGINPGPHLQQLHQEILRDDPSLQLPQAAGERQPVVPAHLPPDLASFTGRVPELDYILAAGTRVHGERPARSLVCVIDGMAGVGKTTLAVHAAHQLLPHFPDGQLFLDLHGFTPGVEPVDPSDALDRLLRALGLSSQQIPHELEDRSALYRSMLYGSRMLILLDNAVDESQVAPLVTADPGCFVLVTGRRRLAGLDDVHSVSLDVLSLPDAVGLFGRASDDQRAVREPEAVDEVVGLCDRLPLAIRIAAARLKARPTWTVAHLAERLRDRQHRLTELEVGQRSVAAALQVSYEHLTGDQKRMFRLLSLHPGPDIDAAAAAAMADLPLRYADRLLEALVDMHLLRQDTRQRYRLHDLIRQHARALAETEESGHGRRDAVGRLLDYWAYVGCAACDLARAGRHRPAVRLAYVPDHAPRFATAEDAMGWLTAERRNLLAGVRYAGQHGLHLHTWHLARALRPVFYMRGYPDEWMATEELAIQAGRRLDDPLTMAETLQSLSMVHWTVGNNAATLDYLDEALGTLRLMGDRRGEADTLITIGMVLMRMGRPRDALIRERQALQISGGISDPTGEARAMNMLGLIFWRLGDYQAALDHALRALTIYTKLGSKTSQADAINIVGIVYSRLGQHEEAIKHAERALALYLETGYHRGCGYGLNLLGFVHSQLERHAEALDHLSRAQTFARNVGDRRTEAHTLSLIGVVRRELGEHQESLDRQQQALTLCRESGDLGLECEILNEIGVTWHATGNAELAFDLHQQALKMSDEVGDPYEQARALQGSARALYLIGDTGSADDQLQQALGRYTELGVPVALAYPADQFVRAVVGEHVEKAGPVE